MKIENIEPPTPVSSGTEYGVPDMMTSFDSLFTRGSTSEMWVLVSVSCFVFLTSYLFVRKSKSEPECIGKYSHNKLRSIAKEIQNRHPEIQLAPISQFIEHSQHLDIPFNFTGNIQYIDIRAYANLIYDNFGASVQSAHHHTQREFIIN